MSVKVLHREIFDSALVALRGDKTVGAALFGGQPAGIGKRTLVRQIACELTGAASQYDLLNCDVLLPVSTLRDVLDWASVRPFEGFKVALLPADCISSIGFNILLKLLEEPPSYLRVLMPYSNRDTIAVTIFSRCLHFQVPPLTKEQVTACLLQKGMLKAKAIALAAASDGSVTAAEQLMDLEGKVTNVVGALQYLLGRQEDVFLLQAGKWTENEIRMLLQIVLFAKRWKFLPFPVVAVPVELVVTLAKLSVEDLDAIIDLLERPIRCSLRVFGFSEIVRQGRKEHF